MAHRRSYITLVSSLPALPRFDQAERLPINRERLDTRLRMLEPDDRALVERTASFLAWQRQPVERTDGEVVAVFKGMSDIGGDYHALMSMVEARMYERTIMAALRRRHRGMGVPAAGELWGVGAWVPHIERNWDQPDFKLAGIFPWIPEARGYLEQGATLELERLLMTVVWNNVDRLPQKDPFDFDVVLAYLFKWDILNRWLSYERAAARTRFDELVTEVMGERERLFG